MNGIAVLAYSGGLDTSCAIAWLKEDYDFEEVVAVLQHGRIREVTGQHGVAVGPVP